MLAITTIRPRAGWLVAVILAVGLLAGLASAGRPAFATRPGEHASCMGHEAAGVSPPGSSEEALGGMPELKAFIDTLPGPPGASFSFIAKLHEGSHEACDEALD